MTKKQRQYNEEKTDFSTNGDGMIGHSCAEKKKKKNLDTDLTPSQKLTQNRL